MQMFSVITERTVQRRLRVLAADAGSALHMVQDTLPNGARTVSASPVWDETLLPAPDAGAGMDALDHLMGIDFLPIDGKPSMVCDWVTLAATPASRDRANKALAMAGMRVMLGDTITDLRLAIGSALSIPLLSHWCQGAPFAGAALLPALATLPGAERPRSGLTFAGVASRVVTLPMGLVVAE